MEGKFIVTAEACAEIAKLPAVARESRLGSFSSREKATVPFLVVAGYPISRPVSTRDRMVPTPATITPRVRRLGTMAMSSNANARLARLARPISMSLTGPA